MTELTELQHTEANDARQATMVATEGIGTRLKTCPLTCSGQLVYFFFSVYYILTNYSTSSDYTITDDKANNVVEATNSSG